MSGLLVRVKSRLFIHSRRRSVNMLEGEYAALSRGRSMDFDDLREYFPGDEVKDIDWKATARHATTLVKRYRAVRRQTVTFIVDTGRNMAARSAGGEDKKDVAVQVVGVLGHLSRSHGDDVALVHGSGGRALRTRPGGRESQLELMLRAIDEGATRTAGRSDLEALLAFAARVYSRRMILVIVSDELPWTARLDDLARRLSAVHETLWVTIAEADPLRPTGPGSRTLGGRAADVEDGWEVPAFAREDAGLRREFEELVAAERLERDRRLTKLRISHTRVGSVDDVVPRLLDLLRERAHAW